MYVQLLHAKDILAIMQHSCKRHSFIIANMQATFADNCKHVHVCFRCNHVSIIIPLSSSQPTPQHATTF